MHNILTKTICLCAMAGIWTCVTGCRTEDNGMAQSTAVLADVENPQVNAIKLLQQM